MENQRSVREEGRKKRIPLGVPRQKLAVDHNIPDDKVGRWVNDTPGRIQAALDGGYTFVSNPNAKVGQGAENERDKTTTRISRVVGSKPEGGVKKAYLMMIDRDLYEADQVEKMKKIDAIENNIKQGNPDTGEFGSDNMYVPREGISIDKM